MRSLIAPERTGAFNLISKLCDLFEAKPIYHGDTKTVDIIHMNPFSEPENGGLPDVSTADGVFELHYGKNIKSVAKTLNTDNIVTRLHAYGCPVGNNATKYCAIEELNHNEYVFRSDVNIPKGYECMMQAIDNMGYTRTRYFIANDASNEYYEGIPAGKDLIWSTLDYASMSYIFDVYNNVAYKLYETRQTNDELYELEKEVTYVKINYVSALMDFDYYDEVGLFTDVHRNAVAHYQRNIPDKLAESKSASQQMSDHGKELADIIGYVDYVKLKGVHFSKGRDNLIKLSYDGIEYTTEYLKKEKDRFTWRPAIGFMTNGDSKNQDASVIYVIRDPNPTTFDKYYFLEKGSEHQTYNIINPKYQDAWNYVKAADNYDIGHLINYANALFTPGSQVNLGNRRQVSASEMINAGWTGFSGDYATLYSMSKGIGNTYNPFTILYTPIQPDGTVLTPNTVDEYIDGFYDKTSIGEIM